MGPPGFRGRGGGGGGGFRGGGGGFGGGGGRGGGFRGGGARGGRGGRGGYQDYGPPAEVMELCHFVHPCEDDLVCKCTNQKIPYFNAPLYLENKQQIGKVDEIFGSIKDYYVSVKLSDDMKSKSFTKDTKIQRNYYLFKGFYLNLKELAEEEGAEEVDEEEEGEEVEEEEVLEVEEEAVVEVAFEEVDVGEGEDFEVVEDFAVDVGK
ncbi:H/ACA ribonucleoprotein complex subunit 1 [Mizuhopecten yessoensis]|uniref:H/ACA ribonucleoprotein complex subunit n=1 Tax=Mizuhopecten yessoensis TaxID=6573 RepID=A0A210QNX4_MIZYE|nr:H/ACA ribonucleoprotein complex subunit 1 [Mizuhopecten yessoensis]